MGHHRVIIIGGGNAGLSVAGRLRRNRVDDVVVIEPRSLHYYKPLFSHVAGGTAPASMTVREQGSVTPRGVQWIQDAVTTVTPESNRLTLASGEELTYEQLVVCPGITNDWDAVPGLADAMRTPFGASNYEFELAAKASTLLRDTRRGTVVFSQPPGPASCAAAAQKPMYLACDYWRSTGVLSDIRVVMIVPDESIFGMPMIDAELNRKIAEYGIELRTSAEIVEVDAAQRQVHIATRGGGSRATLAYDVLHVEPPQTAPSWLQGTGLSDPADAGGFVEVDPVSLQHRRFANVWSLGDAAATTNSKSGGALRPQAKALVKNVVAAMKGKAPTAKYNGYSVSPFTVSRHTVVFAEFDDKYVPKPTVPFWKGLARERRLTWVLDRYVLPRVYWYLILKGWA